MFGGGCVDEPTGVRRIGRKPIRTPTAGKCPEGARAMDGPSESHPLRQAWKGPRPVRGLFHVRRGCVDERTRSDGSAGSRPLHRRQRFAPRAW